MRKFLGAALLLALGFTACKPQGDYKKIFSNPILYCKTVKKLNDVVMQNNFPPIIASRNYAYACIAAYECVAAGDSNFVSLAGQIKHLPPMPKPTAGKEINFDLASLFAFIKIGNAVTFPEGSMMEYYDEIKNMADSAGMPSEVLKNTITFSDSITAAIMRWSKQDNYAQTRSAEKYTVINIPGRWMPTPPAYASALEPHWNEIRPFVMDSARQFQPPAPPDFNVTDKNSKYYQEMMAVKNAGDSLTDEQKHIAEFWDDLSTKLNVAGHVQFMTKKFSPPGHWMNIVGIASEKAKASFSTTVSAYAITAIAIFDAFIQCWDVKFKYNTVRPETVINKYVDENWRPFLQTPPFPEYTCGHSTVSSAAAEALTGIYGVKNRSFTSFRQAAQENNCARFYGGIHFHNSCIVSTEQGQKLGNLIIQRLKMRKKP